MTEEEKYTTLDTEQCKWWVNHLFNIAKEKAFNSHNFDDAEEIQSAQDKIIKALEQELRWVSCSERLPNENEKSEEERNEWVLVATESYQKPVEIMRYLGTRIGRRDVGNGWEEYEYPLWTSGHGDIKSSHPKAWMPLPPSYQGRK